MEEDIPGNGKTLIVHTEEIKHITAVVEDLRKDVKQVLATQNQHTVAIQQNHREHDGFNQKIWGLALFMLGGTSVVGGALIAHLSR